MTANSMRVSVSNVGGINETEQVFEPGVTILAGRNATNRTSFLQALMAACGSEQASLKADADEGFVELELDGEQYTRTLTRTNGSVSYGGDPYLDDSTVADLFAFLLETNEARLAVPRGDDLRDIIMRPVDTDAIQADIERLEAEKRQIDEEIDEIESLKDRVPQLRERLAERKDEIADKENTLEEKEAEIEERNRDLEQTRKDKTELDETLEALRTARQELENLQFKLETEQESLSSLNEEKTELDDAWEELESVSEERLDELRTKLRSLRETRQTRQSEVNTLQRVIKFNEEMLDGTSTDIANALRADGGMESSGAVTDQLVNEAQVVCWTCGSQVEPSNIEETIGRLRDLLRDKQRAMREIDEEIDDVQSKKQSLESQQERLEEVSQRRRQIENEIERRSDSVDDLREQIDEQTTTIERLEAEAEALEDESYSDILDLHEEANQLEFELERLRKEVSDIEDELASVERRVSDIEDLEAEREDIAAELQDLRTKIDRLEQESVEAFNEHMAEILQILDYDNIERIWLERTERRVREGRRKVTRSIFDLHIVRTTASGTTYEDTVDHLSESEREVTGLVFALAGYLVHEVYDVLPVMLLDSLEAIDSDRLVPLIEYFEQYADYLIVALLPEDANALEDTADIVRGV